MSERLRLIQAALVRRAATLEARRSFAQAHGLPYFVVGRTAGDGGAKPLAVAARMDLALCAALALDPMTGRPPVTALPPLRGALLWTVLGSAVFIHRDLGRISTRAFAAAAAGVSIATVNRCEHGQTLSAEVAVLISAAIGRHIHDFTAPVKRFTGDARCNTLKTMENAA